MVRRNVRCATVEQKAGVVASDVVKQDAIAANNDDDRTACAAAPPKAPRSSRGRNGQHVPYPENLLTMEDWLIIKGTPGQKVADCVSNGVIADALWRAGVECPSEPTLVRSAAMIVHTSGNLDVVQDDMFRHMTAIQRIIKMNGGKRPALFPYLHQYPPTAESLPAVIRESAFSSGVCPTPVDIPELGLIRTSKRMRRKKEPLWMKHAPDNLKLFLKPSEIEPPPSNFSRGHGHSASSEANVPTDCKRDPNTSQPHATHAGVVVSRSVFARTYTNAGDSCSKCGHVRRSNGDPMLSECSAGYSVPGASSDAPEASAAECCAAADVTALVAIESDADEIEKGAASALDMLDAAVAGKVAKKDIPKKVIMKRPAAAFAKVGKVGKVGKVAEKLTKKVIAGMKRPAAVAKVGKKPDMSDVMVQIKRQRKDVKQNTASSRAYDTGRRRCLSLGWNDADAKKFAAAQYHIAKELYV
jgi:hypothetical protein